MPILIRIIKQWSSNIDSFELDNWDNMFVWNASAYK